MSRTRDQLEAWIETIDVKSESVLDIGGSQRPIRKRVKSWKVEMYKILDLPTPHETDQVPDIIADMNLPMTQGLIESCIKFETVFALELLDYIWNPVECLRNINNMLEVGGTLYLSCHFYYPVHNPKEEDVLRLTPFGIEKILRETGFSVQEHTPRMFSDEAWNYINKGLSIDTFRPSRDWDGHQQQGSLIKAMKLENNKYLTKKL